MEGVLNLHHDIAFFMILILVFVGWMMYRTIYFFNWSNNKTWYYEVVNSGNGEQFPSIVYHNSALEIIWTIIPCVILLFISVPSFCLLYAIDDCKLPWWTVKVIGNQWFWTYEINSNLLVNSLVSFEWTFDSYMCLTDNLLVGHLRLLEVDWRLVLPKNSNIRLLVTSTDVLHCWALPAAGIKIDACPGRLNEVYVNFKRDGIFYGQCSEICWRLDRSIWGIPNEFTRIPGSLSALFDVIMRELRASLKRTLIKVTIVWTYLNWNL